MSVEAVQKWRNRIKVIVVEAMGGSCQICGYNKSPSALDLHHIDPSQKEITFSQLRTNPQSLEKIFKECEKCVLLCANCHRELHANVTKLPDKYHCFDSSSYDLAVKETKERRILHNERLSEATKKHYEEKRKIKLTNKEVYDKCGSEFKGNVSALARELGVSETAIRKRITKHLSLNKEK